MFNLYEKKALLSHDETMELIKSSQSGNKESRDILVERNLGLVKKIASKYFNSVNEMDDMIQLGSIGLLKAIDKFDTGFGVKFSTYAVPMIEGEIKRFLRDDGIIKVSRKIKENALKIKREQERRLQKNGYEASISELSEKLNISETEAKEAINSATPIERIDYIHENGAGYSMLDRVSGRVYEEEEIINSIFIEDILGRLSEKERYVLINKYRYDKTQSEIGYELGISQVQVSRIEKKALDSLRILIKV